MRYKVTAPLVIMANADGKSGDWYGYDKSLVPQGWNDDRSKELVKEGMLEEVDDDVDVDAADGPPAKSAKKEVWEAYARSQGATDEDLDGKSKDDLIADYTPAAD